MMCGQELCHNWTGQGCACEFLGLKPAIACARCGLLTDEGRDEDGVCPDCVCDGEEARDA